MAFEKRRRKEQRSVTDPHRLTALDKALEKPQGAGTPISIDNV
jgi:hypothetical protein